MGGASPQNKVQSRQDIEQFLKTFKKSLINADIPVQKMVLYGSFAREQQQAQSDIDLCVIVPDAVLDTQEIHMKIMKLVFDSKRDIDIVVLRKKSYLKDRLCPLIHEIRKSGILLD